MSKQQLQIEVRKKRSKVFLGFAWFSKEEHKCPSCLGKKSLRIVPEGEVEPIQSFACPTCKGTGVLAHHLHSSGVAPCIVKDFTLTVQGRGVTECEYLLQFSGKEDETPPPFFTTTRTGAVHRAASEYVFDSEDEALIHAKKMTVCNIATTRATHDPDLVENTMRTFCSRIATCCQDLRRSHNLYALLEEYRQVKHLL
jgi:hypothetical protein